MKHRKNILHIDQETYFRFNVNYSTTTNNNHFTECYRKLNEQLSFIPIFYAV